jgi:hypothetical protein
VADKTYSQAELDEAIAKEISGLKENRDEVLGELKGLKKKIKAFEGLEPDEVRKLQDLAEKVQAEEARRAGDWAAREKQLVTKHTEELDKATQRQSSLEKALHKHLVEGAAVKEIAARGNVKGLLPHVLPSLRVVEKDGEFGVAVVNARGEPRVADSKGTPLGIGGLLDELAQDADLALLFNGTGAKGGGAAAARAGGGTTGTVDGSDPFAISRHAEDIVKGKVNVI